MTQILWTGRWNGNCGIELIAPNRRNRSQTPGRAQAAMLQATGGVSSGYLPGLQWVPSAGRALGISHRELPGMVRLGCIENHAEVLVSDYSYRSATMGSIFAARRAGT